MEKENLKLKEIMASGWEPPVDDREVRRSGRPPKPNKHFAPDDGVRLSSRTPEPTELPAHDGGVRRSSRTPKPTYKGALSHPLIITIKYNDNGINIVDRA